MATETRPSPEHFLNLIRRQQRGRLKLYLGFAAGVGKTYEMLQEANRLKKQGVDVVVGIIETHGRADTASLLEGLEVVPRRTVPYRGQQLTEMDLDAILARRPAVVLVDELAHTNAPGSRHPKRYLDVEELLDAGIEVWSTVNVQHLESLNDVVAQITGVRVRETVPDSILDRADEIEVVDLPADDLLQRLREGKVYVPEQARRALDNFFRKGNLIALRELALRRAAERIGRQAESWQLAAGAPDHEARERERIQADRCEREHRSGAGQKRGQSNFPADAAPPHRLSRKIALTPFLTPWACRPAAYRRAGCRRAGPGTATRRSSATPRAWAGARTAR